MQFRPVRHARSALVTGSSKRCMQDLCFWSWKVNSGFTGGLVDGDTWTEACINSVSGLSVRLFICSARWALS